MNRGTSKNYFENKITAQPFENAAPSAPGSAVPQVLPTAAPPDYEPDLAIYHTYERPFKIFAAITTLPILFVILLTIALTVYKGIENPKYFPALINLAIIMLTTGIVYFWYFRGMMSYTLIWYIIIYALLTVLQCICIVIFVMAATSPLPTQKPPVTTVSHHSIPILTFNTSNSTTNTTKPRFFFTTNQPTHLDLS